MTYVASDDLAEIGIEVSRLLSDIFAAKPQMFRIGYDTDPPHSTFTGRLRYIVQRLEVKARSLESLVELSGVSVSTLRRIRNGDGVSRSTATRFLQNLQRNIAAREAILLSGIEYGGWVRAPLTAKRAIEEVRALLAQLHLLADGKNQSQSLLSESDRTELLNILETAILHLKAPLVNKPFLSSLLSSLKRVAESAAEKQIEVALGAVATATAAALGRLIATYFK